MKLPILAFATMALLIGAAGAQATYDGALSLTNVSVYPNPIVAGSNVTIRFQLYNTYGYWLYSTNLQPSGSYPLLNTSPTGSRIIGIVEPGFNKPYYNYTIFVPATTPSGTYTITFTATYLVYAATGTVIATSSMPISFYVQNNPSVKVVASEPQPATLYLGNNQTLDLDVENTGYGTARNVSVALVGGQGINILSSVNTFFISNLTVGSSVSEPLLVASQGTNQTYLLASISYYSAQLKQRFSSVQRINLSVSPAARFALSATGQSPPIGGTDVPVKFVVKNTGTSTASELEFNLETTYPLTPVASTAYIDSLAPGASANLTFLVNVDNAGVPGNYPVTLYEQWKQPNGAPNQQFDGANNYFVSVGSTGSSTFTELVEGAVVVAVVLVAVLVYRKRSVKKIRKKA